MSGVLRDPPEGSWNSAKFQFSEMTAAAPSRHIAINRKSVTQQQVVEPESPPESALQSAHVQPLPVRPAPLPSNSQNAIRGAQQSRYSATAALNELVRQLNDVHQGWRGEAEKQMIDLAFALAERIVRREIARSPDIPLDLVREALDLVGRNKPLRIIMHPTDHRENLDELRRMAAAVHRTGEVELVADQSVEPGGCVVETPDGRVDQTVSAQLTRIREELQLSDSGEQHA